MRDLITQIPTLNTSIDDSMRGEIMNRSNNRTPKSKVADDEETSRKLQELILKKSIRD